MHIYSVKHKYMFMEAIAVVGCVLCRYIFRVDLKVNARARERLFRIYCAVRIGFDCRLFTPFQTQ